MTQIDNTQSLTDINAARPQSFRGMEIKDPDIQSQQSEQ